MFSLGKGRVFIPSNILEQAESKDIGQGFIYIIALGNRYSL